jgi:hypothetical protein
VKPRCNPPNVVQGHPTPKPSQAELNLIPTTDKVFGIWTKTDEDFVSGTGQQPKNPKCDWKKLSNSTFERPGYLGTSFLIIQIHCTGSKT